jgi:phosphosulfolactate synthase (CoM biosynthesis protein A)
LHVGYNSFEAYAEIGRQEAEEEAEREAEEQEEERENKKPRRTQELDTAQAHEEGEGGPTSHSASADPTEGNALPSTASASDAAQYPSSAGTR